MSVLWGKPCKKAKKAIQYAWKKIANVDASMALKGETAAQRANDDEAVQAESLEKQDNEVQVESAQN